MEYCQKNLEKTAQRGEFTGQIADQRSLGSDHKLMIIGLTGRGAEIFRQAKAGQFVQISCGNITDGSGINKSGPTLLRRPFSMAGVRREFYRGGIGAKREDEILGGVQNDKGVDQNDKSGAQNNEGGDEIIYVEIIYRLVGPGTNWMAGRGIGEEINLLGPLGNGFTPPDDRKSKIILAGGGVGLPPLYFWADQLVEAGYENVVGFAGAQGKDLFAGELNKDDYDASEPLQSQMVIKQWARSGTCCIAATEDGSFGFTGSVVEALERFIDAHGDGPETYLYACGPYGMLKAAAEAAQRRKMVCQVCMEAYMACGIGVCQSCAVLVREKPSPASPHKDGQGTQYKLVCSNGPVFDAEEVVWELVKTRR